MDTSVLVLLLSFIVFMLMNVPIAVSLGLSTFLAIFATGEVDQSVIIAQQMTSGVEKFSLLAIPFFILAGVLMGKGGIARRLIDFANAIFGRVPGGLAQVNTATCMMFGSISGSAAAAVSSVGGFMIPEMNRKGYNREFNIAVTTAAATTGLMIPPSNIMIVYAVAVGGSVSIAAMFLAGIIPGILVGLAIMIVNFIICWGKSELKNSDSKNAEGISKNFIKTIIAILIATAVLVAAIIFLCMNNLGSAQNIAIAIACFVVVVMLLNHHSRKAIPSVLLVILVMGGILSGIFTATEASAIAVVYAFILAVFVYGEVKFSDMPGILLTSATTTGVVLFLIGTSSAMSWYLSFQSVPQAVSQMIIDMNLQPYQFLIMLNLLLLIVGTFMDMTPAVLIFTPIFLPVVKDMGVDPVHFGIILIANLCIGLCTPPVGTCLFVGCGVGKSTIAKVTVKMLPFYLAMIVALIAITYIPEISLWLPKIFGAMK